MPTIKRKHSLKICYLKGFTKDSLVNKCFFQITFTIFFKSLFVRFLLFESMRYSDITHNISCFPEYLRIVCMYKCYYLGRSEFFFPFKPFIFNLNCGTTYDLTTCSQGHIKLLGILRSILKVLIVYSLQ